MTDPNVDIKWLEKGLKRIEEAVKALEIKLDLYSGHFETKDDARREHERLQIQVDKKAEQSELRTIRAAIFGLGGIVLIAVVNAVLQLIGLTP